MKDKKSLNIEIRYDHVELGNMFESWVNVYNALIESSEKITDTNPLKEFELRGVKHMLRGMAVESLLKTLAISRGVKFFNKDGEFDKGYKKISHNLVRLANQLGIKLSEDEKKILFLLTDSIETGRYPIPVKEILQNRSWIVPTFEDAFYQFLQKTIDIIDSQIANS
ncbi:MAG: hypothetical protein ACK504_05570 [Bacteroidota bacterium]|jgi:hypothetical protein